MKTQSAISSYHLMTIGSTTAGIHGMYGHSASIAVHFHADDAGGLGIGFHGTTAEFRQFAAELIRHADATDAKQAEVSVEVAA